MEDRRPNMKTQTYSIQDLKKHETREIITTVYNALIEKGYDPLVQLVGYILSEDPTYITNYKGARSLICRVDRYELLEALVKNYLGLE